MPFTIYARMKKLGKQKKADIVPVPFVLEKKPECVRDLLTDLVVLGVRDYNARRDAGQILPYLTREEIQDKASAGKVSFNVHQGEDAQEDNAVANAVQCFEDGIYRVFAGEEELTELDQEIPWKDGEELVFTFIRLAMLAGCYW